MNFNIITLMPELISQGLAWGVIGRAQEKELFTVEAINPREFTSDFHKTVDDRPYGGGDGMIMLAEPLEKALASVQESGPTYVLSPQGKVFDDKMASELAMEKNLTFICGRYSGIDQRFLVKNKIQEISIGDYVMSGGELAALVVMDAVLRKRPGVLGHKNSAIKDSFAEGTLLEAPLFTRPQNYQGLEVPPVLMGGDHKKIEDYRYQMGLLVTLQKRKDLLERYKDIHWKELRQFFEKLEDSELLSSGLDKEYLSKVLEKRNS